MEETLDPVMISLIRKMWPRLLVYDLFFNPNIPKRPKRTEPLGPVYRIEVNEDGSHTILEKWVRPEL